MSKERFRIWIVVEIAEKDFTTSIDVEKQCQEFFKEFSRLHLDSEKFQSMSVGVDNIKKTRDLAFVKYYEHPKDAVHMLELLRKACSKYGNVISLQNHNPFIDKTYLERKIQDLQYDITAFNLLNNF